RPAIESTDLLEIRELRDLHPIEPDLPPEAPGAERRGFPVVLDETYVVRTRIEAERTQAVQLELQNVGRRGFEQHLELVVVLQAERIGAIASVGRAARGLYVGRTPGLGTDRAQESRGMKGPRTHLHVVGLQDHATALRPEALQAEDQVLECPRPRTGQRAFHRDPLRSRLNQ